MREVEVIGYDEISQVERFNRDFGYDTCFDYIDAILKRGDEWGLRLFIEPAGDITKWGASLKECADWWIEVLSTQPSCNYAYAGNFLWGKKDVTDEPTERVWLPLLKWIEEHK